MWLPPTSTHSNLVLSLKNSLDLSYISCFISLPTGSSFAWLSQGHGNVAAWNVLRGTGAYFTRTYSKSLWKSAKWLKWKNKSLVSGCCASVEKKQVESLKILTSVLLTSQFDSMLVSTLSYAVCGSLTLWSDGWHENEPAQPSYWCLGLRRNDPIKTKLVRKMKTQHEDGCVLRPIF